MAFSRSPLLPLHRSDDHFTQPDGRNCGEPESTLLSLTGHSEWPFLFSFLHQRLAVSQHRMQKESGLFTFFLVILF